MNDLRDALVIGAQAFGAGSEILRDKYVGYLMATRKPAATTTAARLPSGRRRWKKR